MEEKRIIIDLTHIDNKDTLYDTVYKALSVNDCGRDLDALWDVLTGFELSFTSAAILRVDDYGDPYLTDYVGALCRVFVLAEQEYGEFEAMIFRPEEKTERISNDQW